MAAPVAAQAGPGVAIDSSVFVERNIGPAAQRIEPARQLARGDKVITVLRWDAPAGGDYTATSPVPRGLALRSMSRTGLEISTDGGHSWRKLADAQRLPQGITHLRWRLGHGAGSLTYRAVVL